MTIKLRPYQTEAIAAIEGHWANGAKSVMLQLPTGGGKTSCFSSIARTYALAGKRVLLLSHRTELVEQGAARMQLMSGLPVGIIQGSRKASKAPIQSASVASIVNRLDRVGDFDLVVTDEAHHAKASSYLRIYERFSKAKQLGVTATPIRTDGSGFDDLFQVMVQGPQMKQMIADGYLSPYRLIADPHAMSTKGVRKFGGDYSAKQLAEENDAGELSGDIVSSYMKHCPGKRCLVFAVNVEHSMAIAERYQAAGIAAMHIDGETPKEIRKAGIEAFAKGEIKVVTNVGLFTEGTDIPGVEAVQCARPTASLALWLQMLGRGLRLAEGKTECIFIDHTSNYVDHGMPCRPRTWSLEGGVIDDGSVRVVVDKDAEIVTEIQWEGDELDFPEENVVDLQEIKRDWLEQWLEALDELYEESSSVQQVVARLQSMGAPVEVFEAVEEKYGYRKGWAALAAAGVRKDAPKKPPATAKAITAEIEDLLSKLWVRPVISEALRHGHIDKRSPEFKEFIAARSRTINFPAIGKVLGQNPKTLKPITEKTALPHFKKLLTLAGYQTKTKKTFEDGRWTSRCAIEPMARPQAVPKPAQRQLATAGASIPF